MSLGALLGLSLAIIVTFFSASVPARSDWRLSFEDDFDGSTIDAARWETHDPWGAESNHELQAYVGDAFELKGGILRIVAERRDAFYDHKLRHFTSGMLTTYRKFSQEFGRFEIRCRVPKGKGLWPAFWLLPDPLEWPPEIDALEVLGHDTNTIYFTHHWGGIGDKHRSHARAWHADVDLSRDFHVIAVEWTPTDIRWQLDGVERFRSTRSIPQGKMFVLLNLAVGGDWPGSPNDTTPFPSAFEIDWVRCYTRD